MKKAVLVVLMVFLVSLSAAQISQTRGSGGNLIFQNATGDVLFNISESGGVSMNANEIQDFFNQTACGDDEAIKTVYPNGSYACNKLSTTTEAEGLSETLEVNNTANQSIDMGTNSIDLQYVSIRGGPGIEIGDSNTDTERSGGIAIGLGADAGYTGYEGGLAIGENAQSTAQAVPLIEDSYYDPVDHSVAIGRDTFADNEGVALGSYSNASEGGSTAIGNRALASDIRSVALGLHSSAYENASVAIGYNATAPNTYEATFGNLNGEELDVNVTGNLTVHGKNLTFANNATIDNFFDQDKCADDEAIKTIYPNGSYSCNQISSTSSAENLSETLEAGNDAGDHNLNMSGNNITEVDTVKGTSPVRFADDIDMSGNNITSIGKISLSEGASTYRMRIGGEKAFYDGFEDGSLDPFKTVDGTSWSIVSDNSIGGYSAESSVSSDGETSVLGVNKTVGEKLYFRYRYTSESGSSSLVVNGTSYSLGGTGGVWSVEVIDVEPGFKNLKWKVQAKDCQTEICYVGTSVLALDDVKSFNNTQRSLSLYGDLLMNGANIRAINRTTFVNGVVLGKGARAPSTGVAVGAESRANSTAVAVGNSASSDEESIAIGSGADSQASRSIAIGDRSTVRANNSIAIGDNVIVDVENKMKVGDNNYQINDLVLSNTTITDSVAGNVTVGQDLKVEGDVYSTGADLAEVYSTEEDYEPGTLVKVSSGKEEMEAVESRFGSVVGVVSTDPGQVLNYNEDGQMIALAGKVPVKVGEKVEKGEKVAAGENGKAVSCSTEEATDSLDSSSTRAEIVEAVKEVESNQECLTASFGKALEDSKNGLVEVKLE